LLADDGWYHVRTTGSHRQFKHASTEKHSSAGWIG
jgi:predicted RNA binding protein YcfA (HicA-like mRNA interferase family)